MYDDDLREIIVDARDSSVLEKITIRVRPNPVENNVRSVGDNSSSMTVLFKIGTEYFYPNVPNNTISEILFSNSIGSAFNRLIGNNKNINYVKVV